MATKKTETTTQKTKGTAATPTPPAEKPTRTKRSSKPAAPESTAPAEAAVEPKPKPRSWTRPAEETVAAAEPDAPASAPKLEALDAEPAKTTRPKKGDTAEPTPKKERPPKEDLVVFAFRLTEAERDAIHKTAGPRNATQFVRRVAVAFAREDGHAFRDVVDEARKLRG